MLCAESPAPSLIPYVVHLTGLSKQTNHTCIAILISNYSILTGRSAVSSERLVSMETVASKDSGFPITLRAQLPVERREHSRYVECSPLRLA